VNEVDLSVYGIRRNLSHLNDPIDWCLVDQHPKDLGVLVLFSLAVSRSLGIREGLVAALATKSWVA